MTQAAAARGCRPRPRQEGGLSQGAGLPGWHAPAAGLLIAAYAVLAVRIAMLAARILIRARPSI
jgi:hypothetical protein